MSKISILRSRQAIITFISLFSVLLCLSIFRPSPPDYISTLSPVKHLYSLVQKPEVAPPLDPFEILSVLYEDERVSLLNEYDQIATEALVRTAPGGLDPDFNRYITRLESFVDRYFNHSAYHPIITNTLTRMVNAQPPLEDREFSKYVFSFDKNGVQGVPDEFAWWHGRLDSKGWKIEVADDETMESWFAESAASDPETTQDEVDRTYSGQARWEEMWHGLGRPVLKSDLLRYLLLLVKGGLYTDSDTSILSDPDLWGIHAKDYTPRGLAALQRAMRHLDPSHPSSKHQIPSFDDALELAELEVEQENKHHSTYIRQVEQVGTMEEADMPALEIDGPREEPIPVQELDFASTLVKDITKGINNPRVSLVVAVEYDVHHERQDPRFGYTRDLQIVQWTMMAKPFHPIYLDVLETATTEIMNRRQQANQHDSWQSILDVTGPGPFTDAVLRYVLVQYGVTPNELLGMEHGALIGDVLILPLHAFGSYLGGENDWNAEDPSTRCTAHGFRGRWKGDINFDRRG